jgi:hypothetical protein
VPKILPTVSCGSSDNVARFIRPVEGWRVTTDELARAAQPIDDIDRDPPCLVFGERLGSRSRVVEMYVSELLPVVVLHDEIGFAFFNGPGRREAAWGGHDALTKEPIKIKRPADNDCADERPNECAKPSTRLVGINDAEPSATYSRD